MKIKVKKTCLILIQHFHLTLESIIPPHFFFLNICLKTYGITQKLYRKMLISRFAAGKYYPLNV